MSEKILNIPDMTITQTATGAVLLSSVAMNCTLFMTPNYLTSEIEALVEEYRGLIVAGEVSGKPIHPLRGS